MTLALHRVRGDNNSNKSSSKSIVPLYHLSLIKKLRLTNVMKFTIVNSNKNSLPS